MTRGRSGIKLGTNNNFCQLDNLTNRIKLNQTHIFDNAFLLSMNVIGGGGIKGLSPTMKKSALFWLDVGEGIEGA